MWLYCIKGIGEIEEHRSYWTACFFPTTFPAKRYSNLEVVWIRRIILALFRPTTFPAGFIQTLRLFENEGLIWLYSDFRACWIWRSIWRYSHHQNFWVRKFHLALFRLVNLFVSMFALPLFTPFGHLVPRFNLAFFSEQSAVSKGPRSVVLICPHSVPVTGCLTNASPGGPTSVHRSAWSPTGRHFNISPNRLLCPLSCQPDPLPSLT